MKTHETGPLSAERVAARRMLDTTLDLMDYHRRERHRLHADGFRVEDYVRIAVSADIDARPRRAGP